MTEFHETLERMITEAAAKAKAAEVRERAGYVLAKDDYANLLDLQEAVEECTTMEEVITALAEEMASIEDWDQREERPES